MVTLVSDIIRDGYRESNLVALNAEPNANQTREALRLLNSFVFSLYNQELTPYDLGKGGSRRPTSFPDNTDLIDWFIPENTRLMLNLLSPTTVYLPPVPTDGARIAVVGNKLANPLTLAGNGRTIEGSATLQLSTTDVYEYIYQADTGNWARISPLASTDIWPYPVQFDSLFATGLAMRANPRYDQVVDAQTLAEYARVMRIFKARYQQTEEVLPEPALSLIGNKMSIGYAMAQGLFNAGYPFISRFKRW